MKLGQGTFQRGDEWPPWVTLGRNYDIGKGVVLGSEGFGYEKADDGEWQRRPHEFGVVLGDDVSIGANTVIDRGRHRDTVIGDGTKIDALVFVAHNVVIGRRCIIIANAMIAGSCEIGDDVWIGPGAQITDHVKIGDGARIGMGAVVLRDVPAGETWVGNPARRLRSKDEAGGLQRLEQLLALDRPGVSWRHDVDYEPECALRMAEFEAERGISATYYLMARSPDYETTGELLWTISRLGHVLGTHVDLCLPRDAHISDSVLQGRCVEQRAQLQQLTSAAVITRRISFHQPPHAVIGRQVIGFYSAQSPEWVGSTAGDSRGVFRVNPEELIAKTFGPVQINLHPEWWFLPPAKADALRAREADKP